MVVTQCDSCGKTFAIKNDTPDPNIHYFQDFDFCDECYEKLEQNLRTGLRNAGNDMKSYLPNSHEIAKSMCTGSKKAK